MSELKIEEPYAKYLLESDFILVGGADFKNKFGGEIHEILTRIHLETQLQVPNVANLTALVGELVLARDKTVEKFAESVASTDFSSPEFSHFSSLVAEINGTANRIAKIIEKRTAEIDANPEAARMMYADQIEAARAALQRNTDRVTTPTDGEKMSATTDKDYIDARLKAMSDSLDQRLETAAAKSDGRLEVIETRLDGRLASIEHMLAAKFAALDANVHKTNGDTIKWTVGLFITIGLLGLALMTFLINNSGKFSAVQPPAATSAAQSGATAPAANAASQVVPPPPAVKP